jgi:hypothetical protein
MNKKEIESPIPMLSPIKDRTVRDHLADSRQQLPAGWARREHLPPRARCCISRKHGRRQSTQEQALQLS